MTMKLKLHPRATLKSKSLTRFPASVVGGDGITVTTVGGVVTVSANAGGGIFQISDADLTALAALSGTGIARRTGAGAWSVGTTVSAVEGGTGQASYTVGDLLYASTTTTLSKLAAGTSGYALIAAGAGLAPSYQGFLQAGTGATTRTWQDKARERVSVQDFGAFGNGAVETAELQAAFDYQKSTGCRLTAPAKTFLFTNLESLDGSYPFVLEGEGSGQGPGILSSKCTIFKSTVSTGHMLDIRSAFGPDISGILFDYSGAGHRGADTAAIHISGPISPAAYMSYSKIINCAFSKQFYNILETNCAGGLKSGNLHYDWAHSAVINEQSDASIEISIGDVVNDHFFGDTAASTSQIACINSRGGYLRVSGGGILGAQFGILLAPVISAGPISIKNCPIEENAVVGVALSSSGGGSFALVQIDGVTFTVTATNPVATATNNILVDAGITIVGLQVIGCGFRSHSSAGTIKSVEINSGKNVLVANNVTECLSGTQVAFTIGAGVTAPAILENNELTVTGGSCTKYSVDADTTIIDPQGLTVASLPSTVKDGSRFWVTDCNPVLSTPTTTVTNPGAWVERRNGAYVTVIAGVAAVPQGGTGGTSWTINGIMLGQGSSPLGVTADLMDGQIPVGQTGAAPLPKTITGDWTLSAAGTATLATVNSNVGTFGSATQSVQYTVNGKGLITAAANVTITPAASSITDGSALTKADDTNVTLTLGGTPSTALLAATSLTLGWTGQLAVSRGGTGISSFGTGVATALGVNVGSAGAPVLFNGAGGTPLSLVLTNATGLPIAGGGTSAMTASGARIALNTVATVKTQKFTADGTYTPSTGLIYAIIECVGSGGGGGAVDGTTSQFYVGGGGGAGSYSRLIATAATIGASQAVTIGAAGTGGAAGANNGTAGSDVSVGSLCIGKGGAGGLFGSAGQFPLGGGGGVAGTGDVTSAGSSGQGGFYNSENTTIASPAGAGGSSAFGGGGSNAAVNTNGTAASNYGSGGGGGITNTATDRAGGNGSTGIVIITEFCNQ